MKAARAKFNFKAQSPKWVQDDATACFLCSTSGCKQVLHADCSSSVQRAAAAERWHRLHPQAGRRQLVRRRASRTSRYIPRFLRGGEFVRPSRVKLLNDRTCRAAWVTPRVCLRFCFLQRSRLLSGLLPCRCWSTVKLWLCTTSTPTSRLNFRFVKWVISLLINSCCCRRSYSHGLFFSLINPVFIQLIINKIE